MKNIRHIKIFTLIGLLLLIALQTIWVYNAYGLVSKQLSLELNRILSISINRELIIRERLVVNSLTNEVIGASLNSYDKGTVGSTEILLQEFFANKGYPIALHVMDTIFHSEINKHKINDDFIINRINPQTGEILETTDSNKAGKLRGAMASEIIPIRMDGSEGVQVLLTSPYRSIFRKMILILVLSAIILLFVTYIFFFLVKSFLKERRIRRLQTDFSHALIHDMATPLQTIFQINALMGNEKYITDSEKRSKGLEVAQQQIINLQALTDRILTVARAEQSRLVPETELVDVNDMIEELKQKFLHQAKKEVVFNTNYNPELISFIADRTMLVNAVSNLIDNSIKYSHQTVHIDIECQLLANGLYIKVKDDGYGLSDKEQRIIFAKFERGPAVKRQEAKGFGLGLAYIKSVAEAHHGTVNLHSKKGEGTMFELFLPLP